MEHLDATKGFLNSLPHSFFFRHGKIEGSLIGCVYGTLTIVCLKKMNEYQLRFMNRMRKCGAEIYYAYSFDDITQIAKQEGWIDELEENDHFIGIR